MENETIEGMDNAQDQVQETAPEQQSEGSGLQFFDNTEEAAASLISDPQEEPEQFEESSYVDPEAAPAQEEVHEEQPDSQNQEEEYSDEEIEAAVLTFLSERLGREVEDLDSFSQPLEVDERLATIQRFVEDTGRSPQDWFAYQSLNPSEMDDMTAIRVQMATDYPNLSSDEIMTLVGSKYKTDEDLYSEDEVRLANLQLKMDAGRAREEIDGIRSEYLEPEVSDRQTDDSEPIADEAFISGLVDEVESMEGLEFDLGNGNSWTFGLEQNQLQEIFDNNSKLDNYFDPYIREDGSWDYDMLNSHRAVLNNIDQIVSAAYRQGQGDGQKGLVDRAANVGAVSPTQNTGQPNEASVPDQLKQIMMGGGSPMTFNI